MSDTKRTSEEYVKHYANDYCGGDMQKAKEHAMVREVLKQIQETGDIKE